MSEIRQFEPVPFNQVPGMTPGAVEAAQNPMYVQSPWNDPTAIQHMMLAVQAQKDFDQFASKNIISRMVPGKRVKSFIRVPYAMFSPSQASQIGPYADVASDLYVPVMEDEDDQAAFKRYQLDQSKWNMEMVPFRWANLLVDKALPKTAIAAARYSPQFAAGPMALDALRAHMEANAPFQGSEILDTERQWLTPDWTWAVFGGATDAGVAGARAGMLRFAESPMGQAFETAFQRAGVDTLKRMGIEVAEATSKRIGGLGRGSPLFQWIGSRAGRKAFSQINPGTYVNAERALRESNALLQITPEGLNVGFRTAAPQNMEYLRSALTALKMEMSAAGTQARFRIFTGVPSTFGASIGGGAGAGLIAADQLAAARTPEERQAILDSIPSQMAVGAALPLGVAAAMRGLGALSRFGRGGASPFPPMGRAYPSLGGAPEATPGGGSPGGVVNPITSLTKLVPSRTITPPGPPRILGEGGGPIGLPPSGPGPFGPQSPDSGFFTHPLPGIPIPESGSALDAPSNLSFQVNDSLRQIQETLPFVQDTKQVFQTRQLLDQLSSQQTQQVALMESMGADPVALETGNHAIKARLDTVHKLLGKDLAGASQVLGLPAESLLFDPVFPPGAAAIEPIRMQMLQWAYGIAHEAAAQQVPLAALTADLQPPGNPWDLQTMQLRTAALAQRVRGVAPTAAVGPPSEMTPDLPPEIRQAPPVNIEPISSAPLPDPLSLRGQDFPTAAELRRHPAAVRRQTIAASKLASGLAFHVGDFTPNRMDALSDLDGIRVPVHQDAAGRLMARIPSPTGHDTVPVEITDDLRRAYMPAAGMWEFHANPLAPVPYRFDPEAELLEVDQSKFGDRQWARDAYKSALWSHVQGGFEEAAPFSNPIITANMIAAAPPRTLQAAEGMLGEISQQLDRHRASVPTLVNAREHAGPKASRGAVGHTHSEMLREHASMGMLLEHARALALRHRQQLEWMADPIPGEFGPPEPTGDSVALFNERLTNGAKIFSKLLQILTESKQTTWRSDQLMNFLKGRGVRNIEMAVVGLEPAIKKLMEDSRLNKKGAFTKEDLLSLLREPEVHQTYVSKWESYTLKGVKKNYQEVLVQWDPGDNPLPAPEVKPLTEDDFEPINEPEPTVHDLDPVPGYDSVGNLSWDLYPGQDMRGVVNRYQEGYTYRISYPARVETPAGKDDPERGKDSHFAEHNVVGFFRKSDRHMQPKENPEDPDLYQPDAYFVEEFQRGQWLTRVEESNLRPTPFQDTWKQLLLKEALLHAASSGKRWFAWSTAQTQRERWSSLVKQNVGNIRWSSTPRRSHALYNGLTNYADKYYDTYEEAKAAMIAKAKELLAAVRTPKSDFGQSVQIEYSHPEAPTLFSFYRTVGEGELTPHVGAQYAAQIKQAMKEGAPGGTIQVDADNFAIGLHWADELYDRTIPNELAKLSRANGWNLSIGRKNMYLMDKTTKKSGFIAGADIRFVENMPWDDDTDDAVRGHMLGALDAHFEEHQQHIESERDQVRDSAYGMYNVSESEAEHMSGYYLRTPNGRLDAVKILQDLGWTPEQIEEAREEGGVLENYSEMRYSDNHGDDIESDDSEPYFHEKRDAEYFIETVLEEGQRGLFPGEENDITIRTNYSAWEIEPSRWTLWDSNGNDIDTYDSEDEADEARDQLVDEYVDENSPSPIEGYSDIEDHIVEQWAQDAQDAVDGMDDEERDQLRNSWNERYDPGNRISTPIYEEVWAAEMTPEMRDQLLNKGIALFMGRKGDEHTRLRKFKQLVAQMAREGDRAQMRMDPRLVGILGANQYKGNLPKIMVKELLQNAKDSVMAAVEQGWKSSDQPKIEIDLPGYTQNQGKLTIRDNGIGMTPDVAAAQFVDIGGSFKASTAASGGFGLAKVAYLPNSKWIHVETVAETPEGRKITTLEGTGEDWANPDVGLKIHVADASPEIPLGTRIELQLPKELAEDGWYDQVGYLDKAREHSDLPIDIVVRRGNVKIDPPPSARTQQLTAIEGDGWTGAVFGTKNQETSGYTDLHVSNNGLYQFSTTLYHQLDGMPKELSVEVGSRVPVEDPRYPFTSNREDLKTDVKQLIQQAVLRDVAGKFLAAEKERYTQALQSAPETAPGLRVMDTSQALPVGTVDEIARDPQIARMTWTLRNAFDRLRAALQKVKGADAYEKGKVSFTGLGLGKNYHGVNVLGKALGQDANLILLNPFVSYAEALRYRERHPELTDSQMHEFVASTIMTTLIHELTHQEVRSDTSSRFSEALTHNYGQLVRDHYDLTAQLTELLEADNGAIARKLAAHTATLSGLWTDDQNIFGKAVAGLAGPGPGDDQGRTPDGRGRGGELGGPVSGGPGDSGEFQSFARVRGGPPGSPEHAALRAEALQNLASGAGWSSARGKRLFSVLEPEEKFNAVLARITGGRVNNRDHLLALSPQRWTATGKYPAYFGAWQPSQSQIAALTDAFNTRLDWYNRSESTVAQLGLIAKQKREALNPTQPTFLKLKDVIELDPSHLETLAQDPDQFDEWVRQFYRSLEPITSEAQQTPDVTHRLEMQRQLDLVKDAVRTLADDRVLAGPHPYDDPPTSHGLLKRLQAWGHNMQAQFQGMVRRLGRPSYVIGWRKQVVHPADWAENKDELARNIYHMLAKAQMDRGLDKEKIFGETALLHEAASEWMTHPPVPGEPGTLDLNTAPPSHLSPSALLSRTVFTMLEQRPPASEIEKSQYRLHRVKLGAAGKLGKKTEIDLAEWMPKLYKIYDDLIARSEQSEILRAQTEGVRYKARGQMLEGEIRQRVLRTANELFPSETGEDQFKTIASLPPEVDQAVRKHLRESDEGNKFAEALSMGRRGFKSLEAAFRASRSEYEKRKQRISDIESGGLRRQGYATYFHRLTVDQIRNMLRDPQGIFARYTPHEVKNYYLRDRTSDQEPYRDWATMWPLYVSAMLDTIHIQPAVINASPKVQQLPADLRQYADQTIRHLKGQKTPFDELMDRLAFTSFVESPTVASELPRLWGQESLVKQMRDDPELRYQLVGTRPWQKFVGAFAGMTYLALLDPVKVAALSITELSFWSHQMAKRPQSALHLGAFALGGIGRAGFEGVREAASWLHHMAYGGPRWYSEASRMGVTDSVAEMALRRDYEPKSLSIPGKVFEGATEAWFGAMRAVEYVLRASTYYGMKWENLRWGLPDDEAKLWARNDTNDLIGAFGPLQITPQPRGTLGRAAFQFKRFLAAKFDLLMGDVTNASRLLMPQQDMNTALSHGGGQPPLALPPGLTPSTDGAGSPPPPPVFPNSAFGDWSPEEKDAWDRYTEPVAQMGSSMPSSRLAQFRSMLGFMGLLAAAAPVVGFLTLFGRLFWSEEERPSLFALMWPWDFSRANSFAPLWWMEYVGKISMLEVKKHSPFSDLTKKEERQLQLMKRQLMESTWPAGYFLKQQRHDQMQQRREQQELQKMMRQNFQLPGDEGQEEQPSNELPSE